MKCVMLSIHPKWCELIASGKKTIEVRKTRPKLETPFKCYIYCTAERPYGLHLTFPRGDGTNYLAHKKVIGEFVCDKVEKYDYFIEKLLSELIKGEYRHYLTCNELERTCLSAKELEEYLGEKIGYGWHITDLKIYDKPKELGEFEKCCDSEKKCDKCACEIREESPFGYKGVGCDRTLYRPPQSWCYIEES